MKTLSNPRLIWFTNTLPVVILFWLFTAQYAIIKSLLSEEQLGLWQNYGFWLAAVTIVHFVYSLYLLRSKKSVSPNYGLICIPVYLVFIYVFYWFNDDFIPFAIPNWMLSPDLFLYPATFLMPTLAHSLFALVIRFTPRPASDAAILNFIGAILVPVFAFMFVQGGIVFFDGSKSGIHVFAIVLILLTVCFLFLVIRGIYIIIAKKAGFFKNRQLLWKIPIALILPLAALALNNGLFTRAFGRHGIFGNFNGIWYYVLVFANGMLLLLPPPRNLHYHLLLFLSRCALFAITVYFFLVLLPFFPFSIVAVICFGLGFLMLTPLLMFIFHLRVLSADLSILCEHYNQVRLIIFGLCSFLFIPTLITISNVRDRFVINEALEYAYTPDYNKNYNINVNSLGSTLATIEANKEGGRDFFTNRDLPYLTPWFNWIVLDNLTLPDDKIRRLKQIFFGDAQLPGRTNINAQRPQAVLSALDARSRYDATQQLWISQVGLKMTAANTTRVAEYATSFKLPAGCWISNYHLYINGKKEMGILSEKKAAIWLYTQITSYNRDPGILYYTAPGTIACRVFPFDLNETRYTGMELIHREPVSLTIDGKTVMLGDTIQQVESAEPAATDPVVYVSRAAKTKLPRVCRKPYFHFIADVSAGNEQAIEGYIKSIRILMKKYPSLVSKAKLSYCNTYSRDVSLADFLYKKHPQPKCEGSFFLSRAIRKSLVQSREVKDSTYPVIIVLSNKLFSAVTDDDYCDLKSCYPELNYFYTYSSDTFLEPHALCNDQPVTEHLPGINAARYVCAWPNQKWVQAYLPDDNEPDIVLRENFELPSTLTKDQRWQNALMLEGHHLIQTLHPETQMKQHAELCRKSIASGILTPATSYLVVENDAQKAMLAKKQDEMLSGNSSLDLGEQSLQPPSPPPGNTPDTPVSDVAVFLLLGGAVYGWGSSYKLRRLRSA